MEFYTYMWLREDGTPYYVGKGRGKRAFTQDGHRVKRPEDASRIILQEWPSEEEAHFAERFIIAVYGRYDLKTGILANLTDGGEGHANPTPEVRRLLATQKIGTQYTNGRNQSNSAKHLIGVAHKVPHPWAAKLTEDQVRECRRLFALGGINRRALSRKFGVDHKTMSKLLSRKTWAHVL